MERVSATKLFRWFFDCLGKVEKKSIVIIVSPPVALIGSNEGDDFPSVFFPRFFFQI